MMINLNGTVEPNPCLAHSELNGFRLGASLSEPFTIINNRIIQPESHYFNLLASMRILRIPIPLSFTEEFVVQECEKLIQGLNKSRADLLFIVYSNAQGESQFMIQEKLPSLSGNIQQLEIYKEYTVGTSLYDCLNTPQPAEYVGRIYAEENDFDDLILLNREKQISRSLYGDVILVKDNLLTLIPESDGRLRNAALGNFAEWLKRQPDYSAQTKSAFAFELTQCSSIAILSPHYTLFPVQHLRKHSYDTERIEELGQRFQDALIPQG